MKYSFDSDILDGMDRWGRFNNGQLAALWQGIAAGCGEMVDDDPIHQALLPIYRSLTAELERRKVPCPFPGGWTACAAWAKEKP